MNYDEFVSGKLTRVAPAGFDVVAEWPHLFDFQRDLVRWALRRGRCAIFADTGLGKSRMQITWAYEVARHTGMPVLILAPLAVARQTSGEGERVGISVTVCREAADVRAGVNVTNYDRVHLFDASAFGGIVLDESSIIKHHTAKTLAALIDAFGATPYKLCCTATPSPNDYVELGTHAEFLGICSRVEMLAEFFVHDGGETQKWRLKGHGRSAFWKFVASWGALVRSPEDLGYDGSAYVLPAMTVEHHTIEASRDAVHASGQLFAVPAASLMERRAARKGSVGDRVKRCADLIAEDIRGKNRGREAGLSEGVLSEEQGQVEASDAGAERSVQRKEEAGIRERPCCPRESEVRHKSVAGGEPAKTEGATPSFEVRDRSRGLRGDACDTERAVRDLRTLGHVEAEVLSGGGSLPQDGQDPWSSLCELQSWARKVQRRLGQTVVGSFVSAPKWIVWCDLNDEQDALEDAFLNLGIPCVSIQGSTPNDDRESMEASWRVGPVPVLISKASVFGWGMNWQHCHSMAFVGVTDSWEAYYQATKRIHRFGQTRECNVHIFASELEGAVIANLARKEHDARVMADELSREAGAAVREAVCGTKRVSNSYDANVRMVVPAWLAEGAM